MSDRLSVHGRTVCITGSSSGMGRAIAEHLGALGATVYLMGRNAEPMEESKARIEAAGGKADLATFDVADTAALQAWIQRAADETGRLDVMINNAGFGDFGTSFLGGDPDIWKGMLDVNVLALAVGSQAAVAAMRATESQGNIINISSVAAIRRDSGMYGPPSTLSTASMQACEVNSRTTRSVSRRSCPESSPPTSAGTSATT